MTSLNQDMALKLLKNFINFWAVLKPYLSWDRHILRAREIEKYCLLGRVDKKIEMKTKEKVYEYFVGQYR